MRADAKVEGPRQSMSWLHTWASLILGWLLYAIFLTGTLSFFQNEKMFVTLHTFQQKRITKNLSENILFFVELMFFRQMLSICIVPIPVETLQVQLGLF